MNAAAIASLTDGFTLIKIERHNGYCKAVYNDGRKLILSEKNAAELSEQYTVPIVNAR